MKEAKLASALTLRMNWPTISPVFLGNFPYGTQKKPHWPMHQTKMWRCPTASRRWKILEDYRKRVKVDATKVPCLSCFICLSYFTCSDVITALLEHGYQRYYGRQKPTNAEVENLIWTGLPQNPRNGDLLQIDRWLLNLASIEAAVNIHDWRHRESCFKNC